MNLQFPIFQFTHFALYIRYSTTLREFCKCLQKESHSFDFLEPNHYLTVYLVSSKEGNYMKHEEYEMFMQGSELLTSKQLEVIVATHEYGSQKKAAKQLGMKTNALNDRIRKARLRLAQAGFTSPEAVVRKYVPDGFKLKGTSTLTRLDNGDLQWVKTEEDREKQEKIMKEAIDALCAEIQPYSEIEQKRKSTHDALLNQYVITDYHLGMLAWHEEGGADWDIDIARSVLMSSLIDMINRSPSAEKGVLVLLGDFLHFDGLLPVTPASRHVLDSDSRFTKIVRVAIQCIRDCVNKLLETHKSIELLICTGNHDEASTVWMREAFNILYGDNPRINVPTTATPYYALKHGKVGLFFHHGHKAKFDSLPLKFMVKCHEIFAQTTLWFGHSGHLHSKRKSNEEEFSGFIMEQHPTLAAQDAYASDHVFTSQRKAHCITYHNVYGEINRLTTSPQMFI